MCLGHEPLPQVDGGLRGFVLETLPPIFGPGAPGNAPPRREESATVVEEPETHTVNQHKAVESEEEAGGSGSQLSPEHDMFNSGHEESEEGQEVIPRAVESEKEKVTPPSSEPEKEEEDPSSPPSPFQRPSTPALRPSPALAAVLEETKRLSQLPRVHVEDTLHLQDLLQSLNSEFSPGVPGNSSTPVVNTAAGDTISSESKLLNF